MLAKLAMQRRDAMQVRIDHLDANPFRHIDRYPIREDKITALIESINSTGFWDNMVGRQVGDRVQIAYGHHRREALTRVFGPDHEVGIVVRDFTDDDMLKIMARENMEEWGSSASIEIETVDAVVRAYAEGKITLTAPDPSTSRNQLRYAPAFTMGDPPPAGATRPYTAQTVADFLGWVQRGTHEAQAKVRSALNALALIKQGKLARDQFVDLTTKGAEALVRDTSALLLQQDRQREVEKRRLEELEEQRKAAEERAARAAEERAAALARAERARGQADKDQAEQEFAAQNAQAELAEIERNRVKLRREQEKREHERRETERAEARRQHTDSLQRNLRPEGKGGKGIDKARAEARRVREAFAPEAAPKDLGRAVRGLASRLSRALTLDGDLGKSLAEVARFRQYIDPSDLAVLVAGLEEMRRLLDDQLEVLKPSSAGFDGDIINVEGASVRPIRGGIASA